MAKADNKPTQEVNPRVKLQQLAIKMSRWKPVADNILPIGEQEEMDWYIYRVLEHVCKLAPILYGKANRASTEPVMFTDKHRWVAQELRRMADDLEKGSE